MLTTSPWLNFLVIGNFNVVTAEEGFKSFFFFRGPRPFEEGAAFFPGGKLMLSLTEAKAPL